MKEEKSSDTSVYEGEIESFTEEEMEQMSQSIPLSGFGGLFTSQLKQDDYKPLIDNMAQLLNALDHNVNCLIDEKEKLEKKINTLKALSITALFCGAISIILSIITFL